MNEQLQIIISAEISKLQQNIQKAKDSVKGFQDKVKEASKNVDSNFAAIGTSISSGLKTGAATIAAVGTALLALGASTAEYRAEQAKLVSAFETVGSTATVAKDTYNDLYRVLGDTGSAVEAAQQLANVTQEESKLAEYTTICQGVYSKWGSAIDIPGFAEAINHTIELGEVQGTMADGLEWLGITTDDFNAKLAECTTIEEREKLVRETLTGLYGESAKAFEENNKAVLEQNEAQAKLQETTAKLGEAVAPVVTAFTAFASDALAVVVPYIQQLAVDYMPQLKEVLGQVTEGLAQAFDWIQQHQTLLAVIGGVIGGLVISIGLYNAVAAVKAAMDAAQVTTLAGLAAAYLAQAAAMLVAIAPYALIVAAIAAVIAIIVVCVKHWDEIKAKVIEVATNIAKKVNEMTEKVVAKFNELKDKAAQKVDNLKQAMSDKWESMKANAVSKIQNMRQSAIDGFQNMVASTKDKLSMMVTAVKEKFENVKSSIKEKIDGAKNLVKSGLDAIKNFFSSAKWELPKIKLPHFSISGKFSLDPPSIPKFSVSWYQLGGIFDNPTLFGYGGNIGGLGENGAEAIVPLEKNLGWLDKLAGMLEERMGGNTPIVLNVDGKVFAQTAISTINKQTRQTGKLALNLV